MRCQHGQSGRLSYEPSDPFVRPLFWITRPQCSSLDSGISFLLSVSLHSVNTIPGTETKNPEMSYLRF